MNLCAELCFTIDRQKQMELITEDPYAFSPVNALQKLALEDHQTTFITMVPTGQGGTELIKGVEWWFCETATQIRHALERIKPDVVMCSVAPHSAYHMIGRHNNGFRIAQRICGEAKEYLMPDAMKMFGLANTIINCFPYETPIMRAAGLDKTFRSIPHGVNFDLCDSVFTTRREYDFCCAMNSPMKGYEWANAVLEHLETKGLTVHPMRNITGLSRRAYLQEMAKCRFLLHPTCSEGSARTISEASRLGVIPIISIDSQNVAYHCKDMDHIAVRSWGWVNRTLEKYAYPGNPVDAANQIMIAMDKFDVADVPPSIPQIFNVKVEVESLVNVFRCLM